MSQLDCLRPVETLEELIDVLKVEINASATVPYAYLLIVAQEIQKLRFDLSVRMDRNSLGR